MRGIGLDGTLREGWDCCDSEQEGEHNRTHKVSLIAFRASAYRSWQVIATRRRNALTAKMFGLVDAVRIEQDEDGNEIQTKMGISLQKCFICV